MAEMKKRERKRYYSNMNEVFPSSDKKDDVGDMPVRGSGGYPDDMEYVDREADKNSRYKISQD